MSWIDVHTHLNMLETPPQESLRAAKQAGIAKAISIGTTPEDWQEVSNIAEKFFPDVYCFIGVHPHDAVHLNKSSAEKLKSYLTKAWVLGVGEIGLDYYYDNSPRNVQLDAFRQQMEIAAEAQLPVEIHSRDAEQDTAKILADFKGQVKGLLHCFTSSRWLAEQALQCGFDISISGVVTFKKSEELRQVVSMIPLDRLHIETDAPFLAPVPHRGKKNHPALVVHTAKKIAEIKGIEEKELARYTRENALRLFTKLQWD